MEMRDVEHFHFKVWLIAAETGCNFCFPHAPLSFFKKVIPDWQRGEVNLLENCNASPEFSSCPGCLASGHGHNARGQGNK